MITERCRGQSSPNVNSEEDGKESREEEEEEKRRGPERRRMGWGAGSGATG